MNAPANKSKGSGTAAKARALARSSARLAAVQGLYQMDIAGTGLETVIGERLGYEFAGEKATQEPGVPVTLPVPSEVDGRDLPAPDPVLVAELLRGVKRRQTYIDPAIDQQLATGWRLVRVDSTLRAILRAGVFELMECPDVPARVVISEYVQIAHAFFSDDEPKVVNGVLDKLARVMRVAEFEDGST